MVSDVSFLLFPCVRNHKHTCVVRGMPPVLLRRSQVKTPAWLFNNLHRYTAFTESQRNFSIKFSVNSHHSLLVVKKKRVSVFLLFLCAGNKIIID